MVKGESKRIRSRDVPELVQSAGERACEEYRAYFTGIKSDGNRGFHVAAIRHFFRWTEGKNLSLDAISTCDISGYLEELKREMAYATVRSYVSVIRCLFRHLVRAGVLQNNPFAVSLSGYLLLGNEVEVVIRIPLPQLERQIREYNVSWPKGSRLFRAALVILAPQAIGTIDSRAISKFTGVPLGYVKLFSRRLRKNGVWALDWNGRSLGDGIFLSAVYLAAGLSEVKAGNLKPEFRE